MLFVNQYGSIVDLYSLTFEKSVSLGLVNYKRSFIESA